MRKFDSIDPAHSSGRGIAAGDLQSCTARKLSILIIETQLNNRIEAPKGRRRAGRSADECLL